MYDEYKMKQYAEYSKKWRQLDLFGWAYSRGLIKSPYPPKTEEK